MNEYRVEHLPSLPAQSGRGRLIVSDFVIICTALLLYSLTMYIGPGGRFVPGDAAKFQYAGLVLGIPHTPGYPLYVMLTALWLKTGIWLVPATGVTIFSILTAAATLVVMHHALRKAGISLAASLSAVVFLMVTPVFWTHATQAGPGALSFLLLSLVLYCVVNWFSTQSELSLFSGIVVLGLAAGHDPVSIWLFLPVVVLLAAVTPRLLRTAVFWFALYCGLALGFGMYVFVLIRSYAPAPLTEYVGPDVSLSRLLKAIANAQFWPNYFLVGPAALLTTRVPELLRLLFEEVPVPAAVLAAPGFLLLWLRNRGIALLTLVIALTAVAAVIHQFLHWPAGSFWPLYLLAAFWAGVVLDWFRRRNRILGWALCSVSVLLAAVPAVSHAGRMMSDNRQYSLEDVFLALSRNSVLVTDDPYTWNQIVNYYRSTNPFLLRRNISVSDEIRNPDQRAHYFLSPTVKTQVVQAGLPYVLVYSNQTAQLCIIGQNPATAQSP